MYHAIDRAKSKRIDKNEQFYNVTPERFAKEMRYLKENGFNTITLDDLIRSEDEGELPDNPIMLTFDDGHISNFEFALPILKEFGFTGVFFLVVNDIGKRNRISWKQARALKDSGMDIGSHGMNHHILNKASHIKLVSEMKASKIMLEKELDMKISAFSIPRGLYSKKISHVARGTGYKLTFTSFTGNSSLSSDPHCLRRTTMRGGYSMKDFISIIHKNPIFIIKRYVEQFIKGGLKMTIGVKGYDKIKKVLFSKA